MKYFLLIGLLGLALLPAAAQAQDAPAPLAPRPAAADDGTIALQFPNTPVSDVLTVYENLTGKTLVRDSTLATGPNLTILSKKLPKTQAVHLIESSLLLNGYSMIPGDDDTVKVIYQQVTERGPRSEGIPIVTSIADLPKGDQVVSYFMSLRFITAKDAETVFKAHIKAHNYSSIVPVPSAQAIVVTDDSATIRQLVTLKDLIDVPPAKVVSDFVQLRRADAEKVADTLTKLLENQRKDQAANAAVGGPDNKLVAGDIQLIPDGRTNRILIVTRPVNFAYVKALIEDFDQSVDVMAPYVRPLKYVSAAAVMPVLQNFLADSSDQAAGNAQPSAALNTPNGQTASHTPVNNTSSSNTSGASGSTSGSSGGGSDLQSKLAATPDDIPPQAIIVGKTRLVSDNKTNAILVFGPPESTERVKVILDQLDVRPKQVYLATVIGTLDLTNSSELSVDLLQNFRDYAGGNGIGTSVQNAAENSALTTLPDPRSLSNALAFPSTAGLSLYGTIGHTLSYYVKALEGTGRFTIMSRPSVYTANNKKASIASGQQVPVPGTTLSSLDTVDNNNVTQQSTIEYKNVELLLEVIPLINSEREVTLQISQQNNTLDGSSTISGNTVPIIASQDLETTVTVPNKGVIMLGGLIQDSDRTSRTGIPVLQDIPVLGALFRSDTKQKERQEMVVLIQPTVIETDEDLAAAQVAERKRAIIGKDAASYSDHPASVINGKSSAVESLLQGPIPTH